MRVRSLGMAHRNILAQVATASGGAFCPLPNTYDRRPDVPPKKEIEMTDKIENVAPVARTLLALIFIVVGLQKISGYEGTQGYMEFMGVPGALLPAVIAVEVLGGLALLVGFQARIAAILLAGFTVIAGTIFHLVPSFGLEGLAAQGEVIHFMKNLSITGGLLLVVAYGPGAWSVDNRATSKAVPAE